MSNWNKLFLALAVVLVIILTIASIIRFIPNVDDANANVAPVVASVDVYDFSVDINRAEAVLQRLQTYLANNPSSDVLSNQQIGSFLQTAREVLDEIDVEFIRAGFTQEQTTLVDSIRDAYKQARVENIDYMVSQLLVLRTDESLVQAHDLIDGLRSEFGALLSRGDNRRVDGLLADLSDAEAAEPESDQSGFETSDRESEDVRRLAFLEERIDALERASRTARSDQDHYDPRFGQLQELIGNVSNRVGDLEWRNSSDDRFYRDLLIRLGADRESNTVP